MWKYNLKNNCVEEQPAMEAPEVKNNDFFLAYGTIRQWERHIENLRSIPVSGKVMWEDGKDVVEEKDFIIEIDQHPDWVPSYNNPDDPPTIVFATPIPPKEHKSDIAESTFAHDIIEGAKEVGEKMKADAVKSDIEQEAEKAAIEFYGLEVYRSGDGFRKEGFIDGWNAKPQSITSNGDLIEWLNSECPAGTNYLSHDFAENLRNRLDNLKSSNGDAPKKDFVIADYQKRIEQKYKILELPEVSDLLRSFYAISEREGKDTNWPAITAIVKDTLNNAPKRTASNGDGVEANRKFYIDDVQEWVRLYTDKQITIGRLTEIINEQSTKNKL